jgi:hypothetical protein
MWSRIASSILVAFTDEYFREISPEKSCRPVLSKSSCVRSRSDRATGKLSDGSLSISNQRLDMKTSADRVYENSLCSFRLMDDWSFCIVGTVLYLFCFPWPVFIHLRRSLRSYMSRDSGWRIRYSAFISYVKYRFKLIAKLNFSLTELHVIW